MGFLRGLGTTICSILLFLALTVFSVAFLLNSTVLSAGFMKSQLDKLDISSIAHDTIEEQISEELPQNSQFIKGVVLQIIDDQEPVIKEEIHTGIDTAYAYMLEKESSLSITISLVKIKQNITADIWTTAVNYLKAQLAGLSAEEVDRYVQDIAVQIPEDMLPRVLTILPVDVRLDIIKQYLKELGGRGIFESSSFGLDFLVEPQVKASVEQYFQDSIANISDTYTIDESSIDSGTMSSIRDARTAIGYFKAWYVWLIVFMVVLAGLIFLINWKNIRASMRALGIDLLIFGILDLAGTLVVRNLHVMKYIPDSSDIPVSVQNWIQALTRDITGIMLIFSIGVIVVGGILMALSFIIKNPETAA